MGLSAQRQAARDSYERALPREGPLVVLLGARNR